MSFLEDHVAYFHFLYSLLKNEHSMNRIVMIVATLCIGQIVCAQKTFTPADLAKGKIPAGFYATLPQVQEWVSDNALALKTKAHPDSAQRDWVMDMKTGKLSAPIKTMVVPEPEATLQVKNKDIYWKKGTEERRLTNDEAEEKNPTFSPDKSKVAYTKNNNLYSYDIADGKETS
jgi:dipeptidyl-peptidase 4